VTESIILYAKWESSAVTQVEMIIDSLPTVAALTIEDLNDVEEAEAAYDDLSDDEKQAVNTELVAKLNGAVEKITQLVLENVDATFNEAKDTINQQCTGTGIDRVEFANRKATFYIDDLEKIVYGFVSSGVTQLFESLYDDMNVIGMEIAGHSYPIEGGEMGALKAGARIVLVLLGHQEYIAEPTSYITELSQATFSQLKGKSLEIKLTIKPGGKEYFGSYVIEFKGVNFTVTINATEGGVTGGGTYEIGSLVEITVTPPQGKSIDEFSVGGVDKKDELIDGKYTFIIKSDVTVRVTYTEAYYYVHFVDPDDGTVYASRWTRHGRTVKIPPDPTKEGYVFAGWFADEELTTPFDFGTTITEEIYVYAKWVVVHTLTYIAGDNGCIVGEAVQTVPHGDSGTLVEAVPDEGYHFVQWSDGSTANPRIDTNVTADITVTAEFAINTYTVTFKDHDGTVLAEEVVEHGKAATAPEDPEREGYIFNGWDTEFDNITSDLVVTATYIPASMGDLHGLILAASDMTRPEYTLGIEDWNYFWGELQSKLAAAEEVYNQFKDKDDLTPGEEAQVDEAKAELQTAMEIIDSIEKFDAAFSNRSSPTKGLQKYINDQSRVGSSASTNKPHRMRAYYVAEGSDFYWLLSRYQQGQFIYYGIAGTGMNPGLKDFLKELIANANLIRITSGEYVLELLDSQGNPLPEDDLDNKIIPMAGSWLDGNIFVNTSALAGKSENFNLVGRTSDGTEFTRTYTFHFVDSGPYLFDPSFEYYVEYVNGEAKVFRDFGDYDIYNATKRVGYTDSTIQAAIEAASPGDTIYVGPGTYSESITINKNITLIGDPIDGCMPSYRREDEAQGRESDCERLVGSSPYAPVLDGSGLGGAAAIQVAGGLSNVTVMGFEIKNFDTGIVAQGDNMNNLKIYGNYIHDVGAGISGGTAGAQVLSGWFVTNNVINAGSTGVELSNIANLVVDKNQISSAGTALEVKASGNHAVSDVDITNNEITGTLNVLAHQSASEEKTLKTVNIKDNTINGQVNIGALADGKATVEYVTVRNNKVNFTDKGINITAVATSGSGHAIVRNITVDGNELTGSHVGIDVSTDWGNGTASIRNLTITGNKLNITDPAAAAYAVGLADVEGYSDFQNNKIILDGTAGGAYDGVVFSGDYTENWTISGNELYGNNVGTGISGFRLKNSLWSGSKLSFERNRITGWAQGIYWQIHWPPESTVELRRNWIYGNSSYGIENGSGATIDAILNYWGDKSGPKHSTNTGGLGNAVSDNVEFQSMAPGRRFHQHIPTARFTNVNPGIDTTQIYPGSCRRSQPWRYHHW
jgi:uncharacterized repeat protein (TIGR02543 family)